MRDCARLTSDLYRKRPSGQAARSRTQASPGRFGSSRKKEAPEFGRAIACWVFNRNRDTSRGNVATGRIATELLGDHIAVALTNNFTRSVRRLRLSSHTQIGNYPSTWTSIDGNLVNLRLRRDPTVASRLRNSSSQTVRSGGARALANSLTRLPEVSLAHFRHDCELGIYDVRDLVLHTLTKQETGAAFVESVGLREPPHQLGGRVLQGFIEGSRTA